MTLRLITGPATEPVTVARVSAHLNLNHDADSDLITEYIAAARRWVEQYTERALITQQWLLKLDEFPASDEPIVVPRPRLLTTDFLLTYTDTDGDSVELDSSEVRLDVYAEPGLIYPLYSETWPTTRDDVNVVSVLYKAGYGAASDVPDDIKQAIRILAAHWYKHREPIAAGENIANIPLTVESLLAPYRVVTELWA